MPQRRSDTNGLRLYERPRRGWLDYEVENVLQTAHRGNTDHLAHFHHVDLGVHLRFAVGTAVSGVLRLCEW